MRVKLGTIGVDSGTVLLGDPAYIPQQGWDDFHQTLVDIGFFTTHHAEPFGEGLGLIVSSGYGDGSYPVYADVVDGRIMKIEIDFNDEDDG